MALFIIDKMYLNLQAEMENDKIFHNKFAEYFDTVYVSQYFISKHH